MEVVNFLNSDGVGFIMFILPTCVHIDESIDVYKS